MDVLRAPPREEEALDREEEALDKETKLKMLIKKKTSTTRTINKLKPPLLYLQPLLKFKPLSPCLQPAPKFKPPLYFQPPLMQIKLSRCLLPQQDLLTSNWCSHQPQFNVCSRLKARKLVH